MKNKVLNRFFDKNVRNFCITQIFKLIFVYALFIFFVNVFFTKNMLAQEITPEKFFQQKIGQHFLVDFPQQPIYNEDKDKKLWESISEDGNMRFRALYKKTDIFTTDVAGFYQKEIKKFVLSIGAILYEQRTIDVEHHKGIKFRVKFRTSVKQKNHREQTYSMFLVGDHYYLFSYIYEGFENKPSREAEHHFFQSLHFLNP